MDQVQWRPLCKGEKMLLRGIKVRSSGKQSRPTKLTSEIVSL